MDVSPWTSESTCKMRSSCRQVVISSIDNSQTNLRLDHTLQMGSCVRTESDQMARHDRSSLRLNDFAGERDNQGLLTIKPVNADMQSAHSYARGEFQCPEPDDTVAAPRPGGAGYRFVKRAFDICFSAGVCAVLAIPWSRCAPRSASTARASPSSARSASAAAARGSTSGSCAAWCRTRTRTRSGT